MKIIVFVGPTIALAEARNELDADYRAPAAMGDVLRAALEQPAAIGLIDGYFEHSPAVWHKEVLFAMAHGVHVFGAASMGALRAAELAAFGMQGVGAIYEAYAKQELEADDEVAIAHGAAEDGFRALSEPLVNVRATLAAATASGVVSPEVATHLLAIVRRTYYPERSYPSLLAHAKAAGLPAGELAAFAAFLPHGAVNQKRADAVAMLRALARTVGPNFERKQVRYHFEHTDAWAHLLVSLGLGTNLP